MSKKQLSVQIEQPSIGEILQLSELFQKAVFEEYSLYDTSTKLRILKRHRMIHLLIARFRRGRLLFIAKHQEKIIGVVLATYSSDGIGIVNWVYVLPEYRKQQVAKGLLSRLELEFVSRSCHKLIVTTEVAEKFYKRLGYQQEAFLKRHWWKKDFYVFSKQLKGGAKNE